MKTGVKLACLLAFLAAGLGFWTYTRSVTAQNVALGTPIAVCDVHKVYQAYKKVVDLKAKLTAERDRIQAEVNDANRQLKNMQDELAASGFLPGSPEFEKKRKEVVQKGIQTKIFADYSQNELRRQDMRIIDSCYQDIYRAVKKVAAKKGILLVLAREDLSRPSRNFEELIPNVYYRRHVLFAEPSIDVTDEVSDQLNTDYQLAR